MFTRLCLLAVMVISVPVVAQAAYVDVLVWLEPSEQTVDVGETVEIDLMAEFANPIVGWGLDLEMNPSDRAAFTGMTLGESWAAINDTLDHDGLGGIRFGSGLTGEVVLATLTFEGLMPGSVGLILSGGDDEDEGFMLDTGLPETNVGFVWGELTVIPEPTTLGGLCIFAAIALRRRK